MPKSSPVVRRRKIRAIIKDIRVACAAAADDALVAKYARFFVEGYDAYGVDFKDPQWKQKQESWLEENRDLGLEGFLELGDLLVRTGKYEETMLAILFVSELRDEYSPAAFARLGGWFHDGIGNWASTDVLCGRVLGEFLVRRIVKLEALRDWRDSEFKFKRRAVPVTMLEVLDKTDDYGPLLNFIRPMMMDPEKVVRQGLGWFLREAWKRKPKPVESFLLEYKDSAPRLIFQYATEKMSPEQKKRFRKTPAKKVKKAAR